MMSATSTLALQGEDFYRYALSVLDKAGVDYLLGGAFATGTYTGVVRDTKDLDCMIRQRDVERTLDIFRNRGFQADIAFPHWLAKVHHGEYFIDLIFCAGNGLCPVDDGWFENARVAKVLGREVRICPPEEIMWQKAYIMERERFDGGDVIHLIRGCGRDLDWKRLLARFGDDWRVIMSHVIMFGFVYPGERDKVPPEVLEYFMDRLAKESADNPEDGKICRGTLLSRAQYLPDIEHWGYQDARLVDSRSGVTPDQLTTWTAGIDPLQRPN